MWRLSIHYLLLCVLVLAAATPRQRPRMSRKWSKGGEGLIGGAQVQKRRKRTLVACLHVRDRGGVSVSQSQPPLNLLLPWPPCMDESQAFLTCIKRTKYAGKGQARPPLPTLLAWHDAAHWGGNLGINESEPRQKVRSEEARRPKGRGRDRSWPRKSFYCQAGKLCSLELFFDRGPF